MVYNSNIVLLNAGLATTSATAIKRGSYQVSAYGTWGGATATLQWSYDGTTWLSIDSLTAFTANGTVGVLLGDGFVRVSVANAGTTSLTVVLTALDP